MKSHNKRCQIIPYYLLFALLTCFQFLTQAQEQHLFTKGLYLEVPYNYGREAIYTDAFLYSYYRNDFQKPVLDRPLTNEKESGRWTAIEADTSGFFRPQRAATGNLRSPNNPPGPGRIATDSKPQQQTSMQQTYRGPRSSYLYLTFTAKKTQSAILNIKGNSAVLINGEMHAGDPYRMGWLHIPVQLKKGLNEFYVRGAFVSASLSFPENEAFFATDDLTLPDIVAGRNNSALQVGIVIVNNSATRLKNMVVESTVGGKKIRSAIPSIPARATRKVAVGVDASAINSLGEVSSQLQLWQGKKQLNQTSITLRSVSADMPYRITFISAIDNSLQYYAVNPAKGGEKANQALFFSVHGAGVEALGQAQAYEAKDWGTLVAPTNRRPRGFNWEDWGRLDALEVLKLAQTSLQPDTQKIYLTGHSMGGHGTWFLGATYPEKWAAIAPCAGYPTLKGYGSADGLVPDKASNSMEQILLRASNQSDVMAYASNYKNLGVYILHGDADRTVSVDYARQMRELLGAFHPDFNYYEYPGGSHWYSNESVDWKPLFDYFKWHQRKVARAVEEIDFTTANPGISARHYWATIYQQITPLAYSRIQLRRAVDESTITGTTSNVATLALDLAGFSKGKPVSIQLDSLNSVAYANTDDQQTLVYLRKSADGWQIIPPPSLTDKGPHRNGTFKEAFQKRMLYVYGTHGTAAENAWALEKARYDAESWYYRGNGAFDMIADSEFDSSKHGDRNIILIGHANSNSAWKELLLDCPIRVEAGQLTVAGKQVKATNIGGYFQWKRTDHADLSVGVITGTGLDGMRAATANQYFAGASGFPDYMFFTADMLKDGATAVLEAGFYSNDWSIAE
ncbi:prolyl oligopeptidase family serine peptidase [Sphingobacterium oryzagri]|uniref:Prolyl oligopeptidase family serine peptidase n=1 Tax=Sphingobacterium oryzagri TaxID=3025669 RepID=A0ABY7WGF6_9SPHI|nr:prolyl oligopeptidase family serine peptidase [Sphingobacterium sp. KACC 22765]WDF67601.1 prolyl oligopeptidase family serine peptidase [Sphingobacterium sp. KACC 22765]